MAKLSAGNTIWKLILGTMERSEGLPASRIGMKKRKISEEVEFYENRDRKKIIIAKREVPRLSKAFLRPIYQYTKMECGDYAKNRRHDQMPGSERNDRLRQNASEGRLQD